MGGMEIRWETGASGEPKANSSIHCIKQKSNQCVPIEVQKGPQCTSCQDKTIVESSLTPSITLLVCINRLV